MSAVRIEGDAFLDDRYVELAAYAGLADADHARGKMAQLWRQCTIEGVHALSRDRVVRWLGPMGVEAIVAANLGELLESDMVRIKGTRGRVEWLSKWRENGKKGGRPKGARDKQKRRPRADLEPKTRPPDPVSGDGDGGENPPCRSSSSSSRGSDQGSQGGKGRGSGEGRGAIDPAWEAKPAHHEFGRVLAARFGFAIDVAYQAAKFRDYWLERRADRKQWKSDWDLTFTNWLRREYEFKQRDRDRNGHGGNGRSNLQLSMDEMERLRREEAGQ